MAPDIDEQVATHVAALGAEPISITLGRTSLNPLEALHATIEIRSHLRKIKPDVMIAYTIKPIVLGARAAKAEGVRHFIPIVTGLGYAFTGGREAKRMFSRLVGKRMYKMAFLNSTLAFFQNEDDLREFQRLGILPPRLKTVIIPGSGVDTAHFSPAPLPPDTSFLMIARLLKDKGVREFGEAAKRMKQACPGIRISLAGFRDTSPDSLSKSEVEQLVGGGLNFLGALDDVRPAIASNSVYVLPSYREGTPRSVVEAMAMGRAVITTDAPGCRETVRHGENGFLVPPKDADALFDAMRALVEMPELIPQMGRVSRQIVEEKYDVRKVNATFLSHARL